VSELKAWPQPKKVTTQVSSTILGDEEKHNLIQVIDSGWIGANGKFSKNVESQFTRYFSATSLLVSNGSVAISLALKALSIGPGDEVLIPDLTYAATASAVVNAGATPIFCDVDLNSWSISTEEILKKITKKTKAIIVVHLYGLPAEITSIMKVAQNHNLKVIEDCAEAFGATHHNIKVGTIGTVGTFSFFPNKLITSGEGGLVTTNDKEIAERMFLLRGQGMSSTHRYVFLEPGFNFRMSELQSCVLAAQFKKLPELWAMRESSENFYRQRLTGYVVESFASYSHTRSPWIFTARIPNISQNTKIKLSSKLAEIGIETRPVFYPLSTMPAFSKYATGENPNAETISREGISFPTGSHVAENAKEAIINFVKEFSKNAKY
jgi:perosamine synthetase